MNVRIFDLPYLIKSSVPFTQWMMSIHLRANYTFPPLFRIILCLSFHRAVGPFASQLALNMHSKQILNTIFHLIVVAILPKRHQKPFRRLREHQQPQLVILWLLIKSGYRIRLRAQDYYSTRILGAYSVHLTDCYYRVTTSNPKRREHRWKKLIRLVGTKCWPKVFFCANGLLQWVNK